MMTNYKKISHFRLEMANFSIQTYLTENSLANDYIEI